MVVLPNGLYYSIFYNQFFTYLTGIFVSVYL